MDFQEVEGKRKNSNLFRSTDGHSYMKNKSRSSDENLINARYFIFDM